MNKKVFIFASDERSTLELTNVVLELSETEGIDFFFLYTRNVTTTFPKFQLESFSYDTNVTESTSNYYYNSLGLSLPFKPDVVLISRESWQPEQEILLEFKQKGSMICNLENSSWLYNNIKTKLELISRKNFPTNIIDIFFDHSNWTVNTKRLAGWSTFKSHVVGIPKFDSLSIVQPIESTKPIIVVYGSMESNIRPKILEKLKLIVDSVSDTHDIYYKPHPNEFKDFNSEFQDGSLILFPKVRCIETEEELQKVVTASDINVGIYSSVMLYALLLGKKVVYIEPSSSGVDLDLNLEEFEGSEYNFWAPIIGVKSFEEFKELIGEDFIKDTMLRNTYLNDIVKEYLVEFTDDLKWISDDIQSENNVVTSFYDEYRDCNASKRVVNIIKSL